MENRPLEQGQRLSSRLGQLAELVEPTLGVNPQGVQQVEDIQAYRPSLFTDVAREAVVEDNVGNDNTGSGDEEPEHFPKPRKQAAVPAPPPPGNPL